MHTTTFRALLTQAICRALYICRGCGGEIAYPERFTKCPMCGIRLN